MSIINRIRSWWYRLVLHEECVVNQLSIWHLRDAPHGACVKCLPRMQKIRARSLAKAKVVSER